MDNNLIISAEGLQQKIAECYTLLQDPSNTDAVLARLKYLSEIPVVEREDIRYTRNTEPQCSKCRNCGFDANMLGLKCAKGKDPMPMENGCEDFDSCYLQFPIQVDHIEVARQIPSEQLKHAQLVCVRLAGDYQTHLGFLLDYFGNLGPEVTVSYTKEDKALKVFTYGTPIMFVPALGRVVYGSECWWTRITSEEELREITDEDIDNCWYVKAFREFVEGEGNE